MVLGVPLVIYALITSISAGYYTTAAFAVFVLLLDAIIFILRRLAVHDVGTIIG